MRKFITNTEVEPLSDAEKKCFLNCHIPYRLKLMRQGLAAYPANGLLERAAAVEAALVYGRQLLEFLGLGVNRNDFPPVLSPKTKYFSYKRDDVSYSDEVKITDFGKEFQDPQALDLEVKTDLAEFCFGASKATAHLTEGSSHKLNANNGAIFIGGCELIIKLVEEKLGDMLESENATPRLAMPR